MGRDGVRGWIDSRAWRQARLDHLAASPLCVHCLVQGHTTPATDVDHRIPHRGNYALFWDHGNWQSLCKSCHSVKTATEDGGFGRVKAKKFHRYVVTGDGDVCAWVHGRSQPGDIVFNPILVGRIVCSLVDLSLPVQRGVMAMRGGLVQYLAGRRPECNVFIVVQERTEALGIVRRLNGELVELKATIEALPAG